MYLLLQWAFEAHNVPVRFYHAVETRDVVRVYTQTSEDFRQAVKIIDTHGAKQFTYTLPEEETLKVVMRGVQTQFDGQKLVEALENIGHNVNLMRRMRHKKNTANSMVLVITEKSEKERRSSRLIVCLDCNATENSHRAGIGRSDKVATQTQKVDSNEEDFDTDSKDRRKSITSYCTRSSWITMLRRKK